MGIQHRLRPMRRDLQWVVLCGALAGTVGCAPASLREMGEVTVWVNVEDYDLEPGDPTQLGLSYDTSQGCVTLPERFTVTQNGRPLTILSRGAWSPPDLLHPGGCSGPVITAYVPDPSEERTTFVFSDGEDTVVAGFLNLTTPMSLRLVEPLDGVLRPGQTGVVEYFPPTDQLSDPSLSLTGKDQQWAGHSYPRQEGSTFTFTVPLSAVAGPAELSLRAFTFSGASPCTDRCVARKYKEASLPVTIGSFELPAGKVTP